MNCTYADGSNEISPYSAESMFKQMARPDFVSATVYEPGKLVTIGGTEYRVGQAGNLIRISK